MNRFLITFTLLVPLAPWTMAGADLTADSVRGEQVFQALACVQCHSVNGKGGTLAPDLGRGIDRNFRPASLAATMWNHAPTMWAAMRQQNVQGGDLNEQAAADLFAYFYSAHFFDQPGDAGRGKHLFESKHCADCHGLTQPKLAEAKPVSQWASIGDPIDLADVMWNHAATMRQQFARQRFHWSELTSQDLADILVYLRNLPSERSAGSAVIISSGTAGQELFQSKGCAACHTGKLDLSLLLKSKTLTDIAAAMWDHEPRMAKSPPQISDDEMRQILSYLWAGQFFRDEGNPNAGARVFTVKHCASCHNDASSGAPKLTGFGGSFTAASMVSALWHHGPRMLDQMKANNVAWPRFGGAEMANLIAYLNSRK